MASIFDQLSSKYGMTLDDLYKLAKPMQDVVDEDRDYSGGEETNPLQRRSDYGKPMDESALPVEPANVSPSPLMGPKGNIQPSPVSPEMLGLNQPNSSVMPKKDPLADLLKATELYGPPAPQEDEKVSKSVAVKMSRSPSTDSPKLTPPTNEGFTNATALNAIMAQKAANDNALIANLGRAGATIGTGISGAITHMKPTENVSEDFFKNLSKEAQAPVKTFEAATEAEKTDPNSTFSVNFRNFAKPVAKELGISIPDNMSAEQISKVMPQLSNMYTQKEAAKARHDDMMLRLSEMRDRKNDRMALMAETKLNALTQSALRDPTVQRNVQKINAADRVFSTVGDYNIQSEKDIDNIPMKELNRLPVLMITEMGQELNTLLANSNVTPSSTLKKILPNALSMKGAELETYLTNHLGPAQQGEFAKLVLKAAVRQKSQAEKNQESQMTKYFQGKEGLKNFLNDPEAYDRALQGLGVNVNNIVKKGSTKEQNKVSDSGFPKTVVNKKTKQQAVVKDQKELDEAKKEGFE